MRPMTTFLMLWIAVLVLAIAGFARADLRTDLRRDPALVIARALVSEAGYTLRTDHPAILHVLVRRSERVRAPDPIRACARIAVLYCSALKLDREPRTAHGRTARGASWAFLERRAPDVVALVRSYVAGEDIPDPCGGQAVHWGSRHDVRARGWPQSAVVDCGDTANVFLATEGP